FFFSSRRRHTRFSRDWSSDVCSSDLWVYGNIGRIQASRSETSPSAPLKAVVAPPPDDPKTCADMEKQGLESPCSAKKRKLQETKIGRASCRERGKNTVGAGRLEKECE